MTNEILQWLRGLPGLAGLEWERLGPGAGSAGLFCRGRELVWERRDIQGGIRRRYRLELTLSLHTDRETFLDLDLRNPPQLGLDQTVRLEQGRIVKDDGLGLPRREAKITFEYPQKEEP